MRGYEGLDRPWSRCIHFVRRQTSEADLRELRSKLEKQGIVCAYVEYSGNSEISLADQIASRLSLDINRMGTDPLSRGFVSWTTLLRWHIARMG